MHHAYFINKRKIGIPDILPTLRVKSDGKKTDMLLLAKDSETYSNGKKDGKVKNNFAYTPKLPKKNGATVSQAIINMEIIPYHAEQLLKQALFFKGFSVTSNLFNRCKLDGKITVKLNVTILYKYNNSIHTVHIGNLTIKKIFKRYKTIFPLKGKIELYDYFIDSRDIKRFKLAISRSYLCNNTILK